MAGAALAACSGKDEIVENNPATDAPKTYTLTIEATMGGGGATTTLKGTVSLSPTASPTNLQLYYGLPSYNYGGQVGTQADIANNYDYASAIL